MVVFGKELGGNHERDASRQLRNFLTTRLRSAVFRFTVTVSARPGSFLAVKAIWHSGRDHTSRRETAFSTIVLRGTPSFDHFGRVGHRSIDFSPKHHDSFLRRCLWPWCF